MLSVERQITSHMVLTISYVGNQGHHILGVVSANPGDQALCLSLNQPSEVAPGSPTCGPFAEDASITSRSGQVYHGTRVGLGPDYGENTAQRTIANSSYNALEGDLRFTGTSLSIESKGNPCNFCLRYETQFCGQLSAQPAI